MTKENMPPAFGATAFAAEPNYSRAESWAARPGAEGLSACRPEGELSTRSAYPPEVDLFYIHPTTYPGPQWNQDLADAAINTVTDLTAIARQAGAFNGCCRIYAPRYRQASARAFHFREEGGDLAYDLAYRDVERAFLHYLECDNDGRPFILFGHSQGALHLARLLEDIVEPLDLTDRMVAAYVVGIGLCAGLFGRAFKTLHYCRSPLQTGCVISWNCFVEGSDVTAFTGRTEARYRARFGGDGDTSLICVNPLTFDAAAPVAGAGMNLGALTGMPDRLPLAALRPGLTGARCAEGVVFVDAVDDPALGLEPLPGGNMHLHDIALFYENIRRNAELRARVFLSGAPI